MIAVRVKVGTLALLLIAGCPRPLTPAEQEIGDVALVAEQQGCVSSLQIWRKWGILTNSLSGTVERDGSVSYAHTTGYDIDACGTTVHLHTTCHEHLGQVECRLELRNPAQFVTLQEQFRSSPPPRSRVVAEVIAVFDHARSLFTCSFLEDEIRIERHASGPEAVYEVAACGMKRTYHVACPHYGAIHPDDCRVSDRGPL